MIVVSWLIVSSSGTKNLDLSNKARVLSLRARSIMICTTKHNQNDTHTIRQCFMCTLTGTLWGCFVTISSTSLFLLPAEKTIVILWLRIGHFPATGHTEVGSGFTIHQALEYSYCLVKEHKTDGIDLWLDSKLKSFEIIELYEYCEA